MSRLLHDGLTAPLGFKLLGLAVALVLGFGLSVVAILLQWLTDVGLVTASAFGLFMGVIGLFIAGGLTRLRRPGSDPQESGQ